jgi:hypothetical protein
MPKVARKAEPSGMDRLADLLKKILRVPKDSVKPKPTKAH